MNNHEPAAPVLVAEDAEVSFDPAELLRTLRRQLAGLGAEIQGFETGLPLDMELVVNGARFYATLDMLVCGNCEPTQVVFRHRDRIDDETRNVYYSIRRTISGWQAAQTRWIGTGTDAELAITAFHEAR